MRSVVVIAPHPDDETLGCGGTLLRHRADGDRVHWLIVTAVTTTYGYSRDRVAVRNEEIRKVSDYYGFESTHRLELPTTRLDTVPVSDLVAAISTVFRQVRPDVVYLPYRGDAHTDHRHAFDAAAACTKWFRQGQIGRVLAYETLSETGFGLDPDSRGFQPTVYVDISPYLDAKLEAFRIYGGENGEFPFPRSDEAIRALATLRGSFAGVMAAEAFVLLREFV